jgi:hypothetical protein
MVPYPVPEGRVALTLLVAMRRIASGGLEDASAANMLLATFGIGYRRPLMFLRIFMAELARVSAHQITLAPCCCARMTDAESSLLLAIESGRAHPDLARAALARVTGTLDSRAALSVAQSLNSVLEDLGRPIIL